MKRLKITIFLMVLLLFSVNAYAELPITDKEGIIIIGNMAYSESYIKQHAKEINNILTSGSKIYYYHKSAAGTIEVIDLFNTTTSATESDLCAAGVSIFYVDGEGKRTEYKMNDSGVLLSTSTTAIVSVGTNYVSSLGLKSLSITIPKSEIQKISNSIVSFQINGNTSENVDGSNYVFKFLESAATTSEKLYFLDSSGKVIASGILNNIPTVATTTDKNLNITDIYINGQQSSYADAISANMNNGGYIASSLDGYIYYSNTSDSGKLYRMKSDGTENTKLSEDIAKYITVYNSGSNKSIIYYSNISDGGKLYKIDLNHTDASRIKISDDIPSSISVDSTGNVFFIDVSKGGYIYKYAGTGAATEFLNKACGYFNVLNDTFGTIYYTSSTEYGKLYKCTTSSNTSTAVMDSNNVAISGINYMLTVLNTDASKNTIYYCDNMGKIFKFTLTDSKLVQIGDTKLIGKASKINFYGSYIYYVNSLDSNKIYRVNVDKPSDFIKICDDTCDSVSMDKGNIYYTKTGKLYYLDYMAKSGQTKIVGDLVVKPVPSNKITKVDITLPSDKVTINTTTINSNDASGWYDYLRNVTIRATMSDGNTKSFVPLWDVYGATKASGKISFNGSILDYSYKTTAIVPIFSDSINDTNATISIVNNIGDKDTITLQSDSFNKGDIVKVYDNSNGLLGQGTLIADKGTVVINVKLKPQGDAIRISETKQGYGESDTYSKDYFSENLGELVNPPTFTAPLGVLNQGKTQVYLGNTSIAGNVLRYNFPSVGAIRPNYNATIDWTIVKNGDIIDKVDTINNVHSPINPNDVIWIAETDISGHVLKLSEKNIIKEQIGSYTSDELPTGVFSFIDAPGYKNSGKTQVSIDMTKAKNLTDKFMYKITDTTTLKVGDKISNDWTVAANSALINSTNGTNIFVAEVNSEGYVIYLSELSSVVVNDAPPLVGSPYFIDALGFSNNGKTQIQGLVTTSIKNTFVYTNTVPPSTVAIGQDASSWSGIENSDIISATNGQNIGIAEIDSTKKIVVFSVIQAVVANETQSDILKIADDSIADSTTDIITTDLTGYTNNGKVQIRLKPLANGGSYKTKIVTDITQMPSQILGTNASSWIAAKDGSTISVPFGKHVLFAEVDSLSRIVKYVDWINSYKDEVALLSGVSFKDEIGDNGTKITLPSVSVSGDTYKMMYNGGGIITVPKSGESATSWTDVKNGDIIGPNSINIKNDDYIGIAEINKYGTIVKFGNFKAVVNKDAPVALANGLSFTDAYGQDNNGKTQIHLGLPSLSANKFKYMIKPTYNGNPYDPCIGEVVSSWISVQDGDLITVTNGTSIGVAEVDSANKVVQYSSGNAVTLDIPPNLYYVPSFTDISGSDNNDKVKVTLGSPAKVGNKFAYTVSDSPITIPSAGQECNWTWINSGDSISIKNAQYVDIAEIYLDSADSKYKVSRFTESQITAVVNEAPNIAGIAFEKTTTGTAITGSTEETLDMPTTINIAGTDVIAVKYMYVVGEAGSQQRPKLYDNSTKYTIEITKGTQIPVTVNQHIYIVALNDYGKIIAWFDYTVKYSDINP